MNVYGTAPAGAGREDIEMAKKTEKGIPARPWRELTLDRNLPAASLNAGGTTYWVTPNDLSAVGTRHYARTLPCGLTVILSRVTFSDYGAVSFLVRLRNDAKTDSPRISEQWGLDLTLPVGDGARFETISGDWCDGRSFLPDSRALPDKTDFAIEPTGGRASSCTGFPYFDVTDGAQTLTCAVGWSGQWRLRVTRTGGALRLCAGVADADFYLHPGETARMPRILLVANALPIDENRRVFRRLMRARFSPAEKHGDALTNPISLQNFDRYFWGLPAWRTEPMQLKEVDDAAAVGGFDTYWLDAAWFREGFPNGVGNYSFDAGFPNGLRAISDRAREHGLRFMLWFEPGRVYRGSEVSVGHPEFLLRCESANAENDLYNYGDPAAAAWMAATLGDFIEREGVDIYREDFNIDPLPYWRAADEPGRAGLTEIRWIEGHYGVWDALLRRFPDMLIDNCSSGGRLLDLEMATRALPCWRSDTGCFPPSEERPTELWHQNQTIGLMRYLPFQSTSVWRPTAYCARGSATSGAAFSVPFEDDGYDPTPYTRLLEEVKRQRGYWRGDFYRHTEATLASDTWCSFQLDLPDEGRGMAVALRRPDCDADAYAIPFAALRPNATYRVTVTDEQLTTAAPLYMTGAELANFPVEADRHESVLVEYALH